MLKKNDRNRQTPLDPQDSFDDGLDQLERLIKTYSKKRSPIVANNIVLHIEMLLQHPERHCADAAGQALSTLVRQWQYIAQPAAKRSTSVFNSSYFKMLRQKAVIFSNRKHLYHA